MSKVSLRSLLSRLLRQRRGVIWGSGMVALACVVLLSLSPLSPFERLQVQVFDTYQRLAPRPHGGTPVTIVDLDEESIQRIGQWPWPRSTLAQIVDRLGQLGAATIAFDIVFSEPDRTSPARVLEGLELGDVITSSGIDLDALDNDRRFAEALTRNPTVTGALLSPEIDDPAPVSKTGLSFGGANPTEYLPDAGGALANLPLFDGAAFGLGVLNFNPQFDGVVRRVPLLAKSGDIILPSLAVEALRVAQGAQGLQARGTGASGEADTGLAAMVAMRVGNFVVPTNADGSLWVYYTDGTGARILPAHTLTETEVDPAVADAIAGHIVLIGASAQGLRDQRATPMSASVAGVTIHAEIIDQIFSGVSLSRPDWALGLELFATVVLSLLAIAVIPFLSVAGNTLWALLLGGGTVVACWFAFLEQQILLDPVLPVTAILVSFGAASAARLLVTENQERFVRQAFGQYLAPTLVQQLARHPDRLTLGGENRELTLLFCDIRGFTKISEGLDPSELTELLNNFLTPMTDVLLESGATIDKYMGDAIMAFWNAPIAQEDHAMRACRAALQMESGLNELNASLTHKINIGIGLNTGICCVGNLGSTQRFNYSAIGDAVNVAARIESLTKQYGVSNLIAETTAAGAPDVAKLEVDRVRVVGRAEPLTILTMPSEADLEGQDFGRLAERHMAFMDCYYRGDLVAAKKAVEALAKEAPRSLSGLYDMFKERIEQLAAVGVAEDWDGVFVATKK